MLRCGSASAVTWVLITRVATTFSVWNWTWAIMLRCSLSTGSTAPARARAWVRSWSSMVRSSTTESTSCLERKWLYRLEVPIPTAVAMSSIPVPKYPRWAKSSVAAAAIWSRLL